jgi:hypothetical protein
MRPTTRSRVSSSSLYLTEDSHTVKINDTLDPIQKTFETLPEYLPYWRYVLYQRYQGEFKPNNLLSKWTNRGHLHRLLTNTPVVEVARVPAELFQSSVELNEQLPNGKTRKLLVLTIYYTTSRVLVQGSACNQWVADEFDTLVALVHTLANATDSSDALDNLLVPNKPTRAMLLNEVACVAEDDMFSPLKSRSSSDRRVSSTFKALNIDQALPSTQSVGLHDIAFSVSPSPHSPLPITSPPCTPECRTSNNAFKLEASLHQQQADEPVINAGQLENTNQLETGETEPSPSSPSPPPSHPPCHADCVPLPVFQQVTASLRDEIASLRSSLRQMSAQHKTDMDALETLVAHTRAASGHSQTATTPSPQNLPSRVSPTSDKKRTVFPNNAPLDQTARPADSAKKDSREANPPTPPSPSPLPELPHSGSGTSASTVESYSAPSPPPSSPPHLTENLANPASDTFPKFDLRPSQATVLIGDSVFSGLHEAKMAVDSEQCQVLSVSGLDRATLLESLRGTDPQPCVTTAVLHVGVNDCKRGRVLGVRAWRDIVGQARRTFPRARLLASSILPYRDQHAHISSCIVDSNSNLRHVCSKTGVVLIDNDSAFYTPSGHLKSRWLRDPIHPNSRGSSGLAVNIKRHYSASLHSGQTRSNQPDTNATVQNRRGTNKSNTIFSQPSSTQRDRYLPPHSGSMYSGGVHKMDHSTGRQSLLATPSAHSYFHPPPPSPPPLYSTVAGQGKRRPLAPPTQTPGPAHCPQRGASHNEPLDLATTKGKHIDVRALMQLLSQLI